MFLVFTVGCVENCLAQRIKKKTFKVNGVSFNMIYVEGGSFTKPMGHGKGDTTITVESFYIGETEVTCGLYNAVFGLPPITPKQPKPIVKKNELPENDISWEPPIDNKVYGTVVDEYGDTLVGVQVIEVGTTNGTITDLDGYFSLTMQDIGHNLEFFYAAYVPKTTVARGNMKVVLEEINYDSLQGEGDNYPKPLWGPLLGRDFFPTLNNITGVKFRLPSVYEWEFAARGGNYSHGYKYSGSDIWDEVVAIDTTAMYLRCVVKSKAPNELGLYDMSGNVVECCVDPNNHFEYSLNDFEDYTRFDFFPFDPSNCGRENIYGCRLVISAKELEKPHKEAKKK